MHDMAAQRYLDVARAGDGLLARVSYFTGQPDQRWLRLFSELGA